MDNDDRVEITRDKWPNYFWSSDDDSDNEQKENDEKVYSKNADALMCMNTIPSLHQLDIYIENDIVKAGRMKKNNPDDLHDNLPVEALDPVGMEFVNGLEEDEENENLPEEQKEYAGGATNQYLNNLVGTSPTKIPLDAICEDDACKQRKMCYCNVIPPAPENVSLNGNEQEQYQHNDIVSPTILKRLYDDKMEITNDDGVRFSDIDEMINDESEIDEMIIDTFTTFNQTPYDTLMPFIVAATKIQALWRGYGQRKIEALQYQSDERDDEYDKVKGWRNAGLDYLEREERNQKQRENYLKNRTKLVYEGSKRVRVRQEYWKDKYVLNAKQGGKVYAVPPTAMKENFVKIDGVEPFKISKAHEIHVPEKYKLFHREEVKEWKEARDRVIQQRKKRERDEGGKYTRTDFITQVIKGTGSRGRPLKKNIYSCPTCGYTNKKINNVFEHAIQTHKCTIDTTTFMKFKCMHPECVNRKTVDKSFKRFRKHMKQKHCREIEEMGNGFYGVEGYPGCAFRPLEKLCGSSNCKSYAPCDDCAKSYGCANMDCPCWATVSCNKHDCKKCEKRNERNKRRRLNR